MEPFEQVTMCFGILERKTIAMVDEARQGVCTEYSHFGKEHHCIGNTG